MEHENVVANGLRQLNYHEKSHLTHDLELSVVIFALTNWKCYLYGEKFEVYNDHKRLNTCFLNKELDLKQDRQVSS